MSGFDHVLRLVDEELAVGEARGVLNAVAGRQFPPATRFALDLAKTGACGALPPRKQWAKTARMLADREEESAASEALGDLSWVLEHGDPETCAAALGATWRAQNPFRRPKDGDPLDVLIPQLEDAPAARALDRAARLKLPPVGLLRRAQEIEDPLPGRIGRLGSPPEVPYSRTLALGLLAAAKQELPVLMSTLSKYESSRELHKEDIEDVEQSIARAYERLEHLRANVTAGMLVQQSEYAGELAYDVMMLKEQAGITQDHLEKAEATIEAARHDLKQALAIAVTAPRQERELRIALRERDRVRDVLDDFTRMYEAAKVVDRATEYVIAYKNLAGRLAFVESQAEDTYKACVNWDRSDPRGSQAETCKDAAHYADEVEHARSLFPEFYPEDERRLPWRDEL